MNRLVPILKCQLEALLAVSHNFFGQSHNLLLLDIPVVAKLHKIFLQLLIWVVIFDM